MPTKKVPLAIIPAAGLGTRLAPATWGLPKELMPIGPYPMIQWALEEVIQAGIPHVAAIISPSKPSLAKFLARWRAGRSIRVTNVSQPRAVGLADALLRAAHLTRDRPVALLLPDNVFFPYTGAPPALCQVLEGFKSTGLDTTGTIRVNRSQASTFAHAGLVDLSHHRGAFSDISRLHSKRKGQLRSMTRASIHKTFARTILLPHFFDYLREAQKRDKGTDEVSALQTIVRRHGFSAVSLKGRGFDAGNHDGYAAAISYWATWTRRRKQR